MRQSLCSGGREEPGAECRFSLPSTPTLACALPHVQHCHRVLLLIMTAMPMPLLPAPSQGCTQLALRRLPRSGAAALYLMYRLHSTGGHSYLTEKFGCFACFKSEEAMRQRDLM